MNIQYGKICFVIIVFFLCSAELHAEENSDSVEGKNSIIFFGYVKHVIGDSRNKEGYMEPIGFSRELYFRKFMFDTGILTYVDSYNARAYAFFANVSYDDYRYKIVTPMLSIGITNKGDSHDTDSRQTYPFIIPKIRIGAREGIFADFSGLPKIGDITNGWVALEVGYKW